MIEEMIKSNFDSGMSYEDYLGNPDLLIQEPAQKRKNIIKVLENRFDVEVQKTANGYSVQD